MTRPDEPASGAITSRRKKGEAPADEAEVEAAPAEDAASDEA